jgi:hypothetical protein
VFVGAPHGKSKQHHSENSGPSPKWDARRIGRTGALWRLLSLFEICCDHVLEIGLFAAARSSAGRMDRKDERQIFRPKAMMAPASAAIL